jgi:hypothetical protein
MNGKNRIAELRLERRLKARSLMVQVEEAKIPEKKDPFESLLNVLGGCDH